MGWFNRHVVLLLLVAVASGGGYKDDSSVAKAAQDGDVEAVRVLLISGAAPDEPQEDGMTGLHWAAERGEVEMAQLLLEAGANPDARTRLGGYAPLHLASRAGHWPVVTTLMDAGANVAARTTTGVTPLHLAAAAGNRTAVAGLARGGADVNATEDVWGRTPLMFAAAQGRTGSVEELLAQGAVGGAATRVVELPSIAAARGIAATRRTEVLEHFRIQVPEELRMNWRPSPKQLQQAVKEAREAERRAIEEETEGSGGYPELVGTTGGLSAIHLAAREGHIATAIALLEGGVDIDIRSLGDGTTPLLIAVVNGHFDLATRLVERGADPNVPGQAGATPLYAAINLHWAPRSRYPQPRAQDGQEVTYLDLLERLLDAGADPNVRLTKNLWYVEHTYARLGVNFGGATPFWRAAYAADVRAMSLLLERGADPSVPTLRPAARAQSGYGGGPASDPSGLPPVPEGGPGVFPIHAASGVGYGEGYAANFHRHAPGGWIPAVRFLLEVAGADVNGRDHNGYTPLHHAAARGDNDLIRYLVEMGADVTPVSREGQTTVDMANGPRQRINPFPETIRLLESLGAHNNHNCVSC